MPTLSELWKRMGFAFGHPVDLYLCDGEIRAVPGPLVGVYIYELPGGVGEDGEAEFDYYHGPRLIATDADAGAADFTVATVVEEEDLAVLVEDLDRIGCRAETLAIAWRPFVFGDVPYLFVPVDEEWGVIPSEKIYRGEPEAHGSR